MNKVTDISTTPNKGIKTGGRQKGTPNIVTRQLRERMGGLLAMVERQILDKGDIDALEPRERIDVYLKLMGYLCPKPIEKQDTEENTDIRTAMAIVMQSVKTKR